MNVLLWSALTQLAKGSVTTNHLHDTMQILVDHGHATVRRNPGQMGNIYSITAAGRHALLKETSGANGAHYG